MLAQKSPDVNEIRAALQDIVDEDNRAGEVIDRLRRLLKKGERKQESVSINDLVRSTVALLHSEMINRELGVKLDLEGRRERTPLSVYEELGEAVPQGLSEQRERLLDLMDRVLAAIVEESCPANKPPEDWDWKGIHEGFVEHFKVDMDKSVDELGDPELLMRELYRHAETALPRSRRASS